jgi:hypothetical protein
MSTHATLSIKYKDGSISGCYVHTDGDTMKDRIEDFVRTRTTTGLAVLIAQAQEHGGIRSFHIPAWDPYRAVGEKGEPETELLDDDAPYPIDEKNWRDNHMGAYYSYLVSYEDGIVSSFYDGKPL